MDRGFKEAVAALNKEQRQAVETIDGPVLVIAGPGTGKTQLISIRVGYILQNTDTPADAILLLTFTEAGVEAIRQRLADLVDKPAYDVRLSTYHTFGGEIFRAYPDLFEGAQLSLIEELGADTMLRGIVAKLPYDNPLKFADNYISDVKSFISDAKRSLLAPADIEKIALKNIKFIKNANKSLHSRLQKLSTVSKKTVPVFEELSGWLAAYPDKTLPGGIVPMARYAQGELETGLENFRQSAKTTLLTEWKRRWLAKDQAGDYIIDGQRTNERLLAAGGIYKSYQSNLKNGRLYDYDDMILRAIEALENNTDLKYSLAERYSYIMLDEFQDTNPAQFKLVQLLTDHPVSEGRPNILAVGDDDQAIYAFQGAEHANMAAFAGHYKDVKIISLRENYRSPAALVETGQNIAGQIQSRLHHQFNGVKKELVAAGPPAGPPEISFRQFKSDAAQYEWIAGHIKKLIAGGLPPGEIAVLSPKHRYLEPLLPYLADKDLPVSYERRENILEEPLVRQLERMSQLVLALADGDETAANAIWPEVLSYDFWKVPTDKIWRINWQSRESHEPWTAQLLNDDEHNHIAAFFLKLASLLPMTTLEQQMDALIGLPRSAEELNLAAASPAFEYYFSGAAGHAAPLRFTKLISDLNVLRTKLGEWRQTDTGPAGLRAFIEFTQGHRAARLNVLNTSPYHESADAVELLTAYGAKGREFNSVFIIAAQDEVWGSASRSQGFRLALPANLAYIRYQGASEDERLRLLYVAATRARQRLYLTSYAQDLAGRAYTPLKYLQTGQNAKDQAVSNVLPGPFQKIIFDKKDSLALSAAANYWQDRHTPPLNPQLKEVLAPRLRAYKLSATDLIKFTDIVHSGPDSFFLDCFLKFPQAQSVGKSFGTAIHNTLRFIGRIFIDEGKLPSEARAAEIFEAQLSRIELPPDEQANLIERGRTSLRRWLAQQGGSLSRTDRFEYNFQNEGGSAGPARLGGIADRLAIDEKSRSITVIDYKIGQSYSRWQPGVVKLHNFKNQLLFYKLLVESSARFRGYRVTKGIIEFVEPDARGQISRLELDYDESELKEMAKLITGVWTSIQSLDLPDISAYPQTLAGIRQFETGLKTISLPGPSGAAPSSPKRR